MCSVSLVRVSEGDGWLPELPYGPNKVFSPVTLAFSPSFHLTRPAGSDWVPTSLQGQQELIQV